MVEVPAILFVHYDYVIIVIAVLLCDLNCGFAGNADPQRLQFLSRSRVNGIADFFSAGGSGGDNELIGGALLFDHIFEKKFRHGRTADVAVANKQYFYHVVYPFTVIFSIFFIASFIWR